MAISILLRVILPLLLAALGGGCAQLDLDIDPSLSGERQNLWPLVYHEHKAEAGECKVTALASAIADERVKREHRRGHRALPLWNYERRGERRDLRLLTGFFPSLVRSISGDGEERQALLEIIDGWALGQRWARKGSQEGYLLPLGWYERGEGRGQGILFPLHAFYDDGCDFWTVSAAGLYRSFGQRRWHWRDMLPLFCQVYREGRYDHFISLPYTELKNSGRLRRLFLAGLVETKERPGGRSRVRVLHQFFVHRTDSRGFVQEWTPVYRVERGADHAYFSLGKFLCAYEREGSSRSLRLLHFLNFRWQSA